MPMSRIAKAPIRQDGFSIVEMMVAIVISLLILAGVSVLLVGVLKNRNELEKSNRQIENGRYALEALSEDLRLAGYFGMKSFSCEEIYGNDTCVGTGTPGTFLGRVAAASITLGLPSICETSAANWLRSSGSAPDYVNYTANHFLWAVQGYNNVTTFPESGCLASLPAISAGLNGGGTDVLVIRRQSSNGIAVASMVATQPYLQTGAAAGDANHTVTLKIGASGGETFDLQRVATTGSSYETAEVNRLLKHIYFIAPCSRGTGANGICVSGDDGIPTLKRLELTVGPAFTMTTIAEGIEDINFEYGLDNDRDGSPDVYTAAPGVTDWWNVVSVRIYVLARNIDASDAGSEQKTFNMGEGKTALTTAQTQFKRHVFTQTVRINNVSMRRE